MALTHMKLAIIGSRNFQDYSLMLERFGELVQTEGIPSHIVSGGAKGADALAERLADFYQIPKIIHYANWDAFGRRAGPIRNGLIRDSADIVLAFPVGKSIGTYQCLSLFRAGCKPAFIYPSEESEWL